jgi:hypothetical protein
MARSTLAVLTLTGRIAIAPPELFLDFVLFPAFKRARHGVARIARGW